MICNRVLLLADDEEGFEPLGECLTSLGYSPRPELVLNMDMLDRDSLAFNELIILNARRLNPLHQAVLLSTQQMSPCPVVVFTEEGDEESLMAAVNAGANSIIIDGIECRRLPGILKIARARFKRCLSLRGELDSARRKLAVQDRNALARGIVDPRASLAERRPGPVAAGLSLD